MIFLFAADTGSYVISTTMYIVHNAVSPSTLLIGALPQLDHETPSTSTGDGTNIVILMRDKTTRIPRLHAVG